MPRKGTRQFNLLPTENVWEILQKQKKPQEFINEAILFYLSVDWMTSKALLELSEILIRQARKKL